MRLTRKQALTLEQVFNWAINLLEEESTKGAVIVSDGGEFKRFDFGNKMQEIEDLFNYFKENIELEE